MSRSKVVKKIVIVTAVVVGLLALVLVLAFVPAVQRRVFLAVIEAPGRVVAVERLSAGLGGVDVAGLRWSEAGSTITVREARVKLPLFSVIGGERIAIEEIAVSGLVADIAGGSAPDSSSGGPTQATASREPRTALADLVLRLPADVSVERIAIDGECVLPEAGRGRARASVRLEGGGFGAGREGTLALSGRFADPAVEALAAGVDLSGRLAVRLAADRAVERLALQVSAPFLAVDLSADVPGGRVVDATVESTATGEIARLLVFLPPESRPLVTGGSLRQSLKMRQDAAGAVSVEGRVELRDLTGMAAGAPVRFGGVESDLMLTGNPTGAMRLDARVRVVGAVPEDVSDLRVQGTVDRGGGLPRADLAVQSARVAVPTLLRLQELASAPVPAGPEVASPASATGPSGEASSQAGPPWAGLDGAVRIALGRVELSDGAVARDIAASVRVSPDGVVVEGLNAILVDGVERRASVARATVGDQGVAVERLAYGEPGLTLAVEEARVGLPVTAVLAGGRLVVDEIRLRGIHADITASAATPAGMADSPRPAPAGAEATPAAEAGSAGFADLELVVPVDVAIGRIAVEGRVDLPDAGKGRPTATFTIDGGGFERGREGALEWSGRYVDPGVPALAAGADLKGRFALHLSDTQHIDRVALQAEASFLSADVKASIPDGRLGRATSEAVLIGDLARLLAFVPPELRPLLSAGAVRSTVRLGATSGSARLIEARMELSGLTGRVDGADVRVEQVAVDVRGEGALSGPFAVAASLRVAGRDAGDVSDLSMQGTVGRTTAGVRGDLEVTGQRLDVPALQRLQALLAPAEEAAPAGGPARPVAPAATPVDGEVEPATAGPVWAGIEGDARIRLALIELAEGGTARDVAATVRVADAGVAVREMTGVFVDAPFDGKLDLAFAADTRLYALTGEFGFKNLDVGRALTSLQPGRPPDLEGVFEARATVAGSAPDLVALADGITGDITLRGSQGVFRGLRQKTGGALTATAGLLGAFTQNRSVQTVAGIAAMLEAVPYDEVAVQASLGQGNLLRVTNLSLRSPEVVVRGAGTMTLAAGGSWLDWLKAPVAFELQLGGKGRLGEWLTQLGGVSPAPDALGYTMLKKPFKVGGSLGALDSSDLWTSLARAGAGAAAGLLQSGGSNPAAGSSPAAPADKAP